MFSHCVPKVDIIKSNCLAEYDTNLKRGWSEISKMVKMKILGLHPGSGGRRQVGEKQQLPLTWVRDILSWNWNLFNQTMGGKHFWVHNLSKLFIIFLTLFTDGPLFPVLPKVVSKNWKWVMRRALYYQKWGCWTTLQRKNILTFFMKILRNQHFGDSVKSADFFHENRP